MEGWLIQPIWIIQSPSQSSKKIILFCLIGSLYVELNVCHMHISFMVHLRKFSYLTHRKDLTQLIPNIGCSYPQHPVMCTCNCDLRPALSSSYPKGPSSCPQFLNLFQLRGYSLVVSTESIQPTSLIEIGLY